MTQVVTSYFKKYKMVKDNKLTRKLYAGRIETEYKGMIQVYDLIEQPPVILSKEEGFSYNKPVILSIEEEFMKIGKRFATK